MSSRVLPQLLDYFPHTRRGHGTTHPDARFNKAGAQTRNACACVNSACERLRRQSASDDETKRRGEAHRDQYANVADWKADHKLHKDLPLEACFR